MGCSSGKEAVDEIPESAEFFRRYALGKKLGEGAFGQVRLATEISTKKEFAVKVADVRTQESGSVVAVSKRRKRNLEREIRMWRIAGAAKLPQVTLLEDAFYCSGFYYMVCEVCKRNLMQHLLHVKTLAEEEFATLASEMLHGIQHLHTVGLVHRDIKPENFLCVGRGTELKICDFGLALKQPKKGKLTGVGGTAPYMAPETLVKPKGLWAKPGFHKEVDLWAFGVILYLILFGKFPYMPPGETTADSMKYAIATDSPPLQFPTSQSSLALALAKRVLVRDPRQRLTAKEALQDPFVLQAAQRGSQGSDLRVSVQDAKEMAEKLREFQISENTQQDLESRLKTVTAKSGGIWFSEGDDKTLVSPTTSQNAVSVRADSRIKKDKKPVSRDKFGTHSGVVSEEQAQQQMMKAAPIPEEPS
ncbi:CAMK2D [Symbiodinium pilosum]|uniref:CAMK2D protein n=1 Tax=Symbiodinium pilosum TaxID=2952 RepID=A0A812Q8D5_SYMPI|nr:CAMK2D [Symbiodinium pilosum]